MKEIGHQADLCVVGGGLAGVCAAIAAARHGLRVVLMQDRPVLGGNASSEIRMWVCGAHGDNNRESGIIEELQLENFYRNSQLSYPLWDSVLYEKAYLQPGVTLLLNCTCQQAAMDNGRIRSVRGWQMTSETYHTVEAAYFADCSGDSILAPLTGAEYRIGREARTEFGESIAPEQADRCTMGNSCLFQIRETDHPQKFIPPAWAYTFPTDDDMPFREHHIGTNYWWIELGGDRDSIHDADALRHELLRIAFGVWDHVKNYGDHGAENWVMDWIGFLPGKRESRRYVGDVIITQNDVEQGGKFPDIVAYGGWTMDDHFPAGFGHKESYPTIHHPAPSPLGYSVAQSVFGECGKPVVCRPEYQRYPQRTELLTGHGDLRDSRSSGGHRRCTRVGNRAAARGISMSAGCSGCCWRTIAFCPGLRREPSALTMQAKTDAPVLRSGMDPGTMPAKTTLGKAAAASMCNMRLIGRRGLRACGWCLTATSTGIITICPAVIRCMRQNTGCRRR